MDGTVGENLDRFGVSIKTTLVGNSNLVVKLCAKVYHRVDYIVLVSSSRLYLQIVVVLFIIGPDLWDIDIVHSITQQSDCRDIHIRWFLGNRNPITDVVYRQKIARRHVV